MTTVKVTFRKPLKRGEIEIAGIELRKPTPLECIGLKLPDIVDMDVRSTIKLLPLVSDPPLTEHEVGIGLEVDDFLACAVELSNFVLPRVANTASPTE